MRSCHVVPASNPRFLARAAGLGADMYVFDLEDAVVPAEKPAARQAVVAAVVAQGWGSAALAIRVNGWDGPWTYGDVSTVLAGARGRIDSVVLPKVGSAAEVVALDLLLAQVEAEAGLRLGSVGIQVLVESARGVAHADEVCSASGRLTAVIFGPLDLSADLRMPTLAESGRLEYYPSDHFHHARMGLLIAARAHGLLAIDGPFVDLRDSAGLKRAAEIAAALGYDGKWSIHPDQIGAINRAFRGGQTGAPAVRELERSP